MHYVRCDICKGALSRQGRGHFEVAPGWFFGFLKMEDREVRFDLCPTCGPQATRELIETLDVAREMKRGA